VRPPPIVAVSGFSGAGKTRLLSRLIPALVRRGVRVGALKHTGHPHPFDVPGKDTDVLRRAGAIAAAIEAARLAYFSPPVGARALARLLPEVDLVLAEGFKHERSRAWRCTGPACPAPCSRTRTRASSRSSARGRHGAGSAHRSRRRRAARRSPLRALPPLPRRAPARGALAGATHREQASRERKRADDIARKGSHAEEDDEPEGRDGARARRPPRRRLPQRRGAQGRERDARARGPEFYSEIGRKGGKKSRSGARGGRSAGAARATTKRGTTTKRGAARRGTTRRTSRTR
jgi:molybdopterin-guanine dinucleotide biosynthesis protein B